MLLFFCFCCCFCCCLCIFKQFFLAITNIKIPRVQVSNLPLHSNFNSRIIFLNLITYLYCHQTFAKLYFWKNHNNNSFGFRVFESNHFLAVLWFNLVANVRRYLDIKKKHCKTSSSSRPALTKCKNILSGSRNDWQPRREEKINCEMMAFTS